jgi:predicted Zn-ribbon and HTH transcriptional regulator
MPLNFDWFRDLLIKAVGKEYMEVHFPSEKPDEPLFLIVRRCPYCGHEYRACVQAIKDGTAKCPACIGGILRMGDR